MARLRRILAIDPGTKKCGIAVVESSRREPLYHAIVQRDEFPAALKRLLQAYALDEILLGSGTACDYYAAALAASGFVFRLVDEYGTTLAARARYYEAHPPRGWRRLLPAGLRVPPVPIDDWAAVVIAERFFVTIKFLQVPPKKRLQIQATLRAGERWSSLYERCFTRGKSCR